MVTNVIFSKTYKNIFQFDNAPLILLSCFVCCVMLSKVHNIVFLMLWYSCIQKRKGGQGYSLCGPTFPSISDLLKHYTESPIPIKGHPQSLKRAVCKQIRNDQFFIHHDNLAIDDEPFCKGTICYIYSATLRDTGKQVAVKVCCADKEQFLCEAKLLEQFRHPNIIKLFSMCVDTEPMYVVLEMMSGGDFLTFLRKDGIHQTQYQLTKFSLDAALGMEYLASQNCLHRNLTARSCLVGNNNEVLKISDFSMCKMAEKRMCSQSRTSRVKNVPVKWIAPEVSYVACLIYQPMIPMM